MNFLKSSLVHFVIFTDLKYVPYTQRYAEYTEGSYQLSVFNGYWEGKSCALCFNTFAVDGAIQFLCDEIINDV